MYFLVKATIFAAASAQSPARGREHECRTDQLKQLTAQMTALREGAGDDIDILLDMNFSFKTEGFLKSFAP